MEESQKVPPPPPPDKPSVYECCGRGCSPCIFDYYDRALNEWMEKYSDAFSFQQEFPARVPNKLSQNKPTCSKSISSKSGDHSFYHGS